jgi:hypothetical protein
LEEIECDTLNTIFNEWMQLLQKCIDMNGE